MGKLIVAIAFVALICFLSGFALGRISRDHT